MTAPVRRYDCFPCGAEFDDAVAYRVHVSTGCPGSTSDLAVTRPVYCWHCSGPIDLREGQTCPTCGFEYPYRPATLAEAAERRATLDKLRARISGDGR